MNRYTVVLTPEAKEQLAELYLYIADRASAVTALSYTEAIVDYCAKLNVFPIGAPSATIFVPGCVLQISRKIP